MIGHGMIVVESEGVTVFRPRSCPRAVFLMTRTHVLCFDTLTGESDVATLAQFERTARRILQGRRGAAEPTQ